MAAMISNTVVVTQRGRTTLRKSNTSVCANEKAWEAEVSADNAGTIVRTAWVARRSCDMAQSALAMREHTGAMYARCREQMVVMPSVELVREWHADAAHVRR